MTIKRIVNNPIPPQIEGENLLPPDNAEIDIVDPNQETSIAYEDWPEPLRTAVRKNKVKVEDLPYPVFNQLTGELNPLINLSDYE